MDSSHGNEAGELFQAQIHLYKHTYNYISSMSLKCAVELGIPDIINDHGKPITLPELVSALQLHPKKTDCLHRFLRLLVHNGFFAKTMVCENNEEKEAFSLTPPSKLLLKGKETSLSPIVEGSLLPCWLNMWYSSKKWFHGDKELSLLETASGMNLWEFISQNPEAGDHFNAVIVSDSQMVKLALKDWKPVFENLGTIVDAGGGTGTMGRMICEAFPNLKCIVFELPHVIADLSESKNLSFAGGDMFQSIPPADAVLLKWVLHDWSDEHCIKILKNCREAISTSKGKEGKVIIIDIVIDLKNDDHELSELKLYYDIMMMTFLSGRERNEKEWGKLFSEAGFRHYKITPMFGFKSLIEVYP